MNKEDSLTIRIGKYFIQLLLKNDGIEFKQFIQKLDNIFSNNCL